MPPVDEMEDVEQLLNGESPSRDIPMEQPKPDITPAQEYTLKVNGQDIKAPLDKVLQWAQMGYNYPQKANELNLKQQEFQKRQQELEAQWNERETKWAPYKEVDEYAAKNPDWWKQVSQNYQEAIKGATSNPEVNQIKQEFQEFKKFMQDSMAEKQSQKVLAEDQKFSQEVESIRKAYTNIDFDTPDDDGKSLEMKVLQHAVDNGIGSFKTAFRDYYHDHLINKAKEDGKVAVAKQVQKQTKLGILGETSRPTKGLKPAENIKNKTYSQLAQEALDELNA